MLTETSLVIIAPLVKSSTAERPVQKRTFVTFFLNCMTFCIEFFKVNSLMHKMANEQQKRQCFYSF